ncbi:2OG-Fe(II) oxygenase [Pseudohongiella spirulinae]|uniref:SM-20-related protein n=1 Tax=Pseudohongiella spirulinae TaxID=1249552 RepID=A0A0S2KAT7_9GAMM|nr:2OG-Fe(II) oxygenase [Pseudohongiella spirulinae]ALO45416.1 SM-20-related protein [Pseudohongiella spirulinae]
MLTDVVLDQIAEDLSQQSWSVQTDAIPEEFLIALREQLLHMNQQDFQLAGIGRSQDHMLAPSIRRDKVRWIEGETPAERLWLEWAAHLQRGLNRRLFMGLFSFESHFAHYRPGDFYKKHFDAFRPDGLERGARRELSLVVYLNPDWIDGDGGELVLFDPRSDGEICRIHPQYGTVVVFLSTEVPHEVLPAGRDRYSIAGWFRLNGSLAERPDPPR